MKRGPGKQPRPPRKPWLLKFTPQAQKDSTKLERAGLKPKAQSLLNVIREDPWKTPPRFEKLVGDLAGEYSRRINIQHRLVYEVLQDVLEGREAVQYAGLVKVLSMWTHYE